MPTAIQILAYFGLTDLEEARQVPMLDELHVHDFLRHLAAEEGARPNTVDNYRQELVRLVREAVPLERDPIREHIARGRNGPVSPATRNWRLLTIRRFVRHLVATGVIATDPTKGIARFEVPRVRRAAVPVSSLRRMVRATDQSSLPIEIRDAAMLLVFFQTGLRLAELRNLRVDQVDLQAELLLSVVRKGGHVADVHLNADARAGLTRWLKVRGREHGPLFPGRGGRALSLRGIQKRIERLGEVAGLQGRLHPHLLRHTYATELLRAGAATEYVRLLMDHSSITTTQRYLHASEADLRRAQRRLPRLLSTATDKEPVD